MKLKQIVIAMLFIVVSAAESSYAQSWVAHELEGYSASARWVDNYNRIAGSIHYYDSVHAVIWNTDGVITHDLGEGSALYINDAGQVAGVSDYRAVVWTLDGQKTEYAPLDGFYGSSAYYMGGGYIVGESYLNDQYNPHFTTTIWKPNGNAITLQDLTGDNSFILSAVSDSGTLYGSIYDNQRVNVTWTPETGFEPISGIDGIWSVSPNGSICGTSPLWRKLAGEETPTILQVPENYYGGGYSISDTGYVAGIATLQKADYVYEDYAAIWDLNGNIHILERGTAGQINNNGVAIGWVDIVTQTSWTQRGVVWVPVPEPSAVITLLCGVGGLLCIWRRK